MCQSNFLLTLLSKSGSIVSVPMALADPMSVLSRCHVWGSCAAAEISFVERPMMLHTRLGKVEKGAGTIEFKHPKSRRPKA